MQIAPRGVKCKLPTKGKETRASKEGVTSVAPSILVAVHKTMGHFTIHTRDGWMARRMIEVVNGVTGCRAEIRHVEGSDDSSCDLVQYYEDQAAVERMLQAILPLIPEFDQFLWILDGGHPASDN
jgi:hypothetical protein